MKTNREKNTEHDTKEQSRVRPADKDYEFQALEQVIRQWVEAGKQ